MPRKRFVMNIFNFTEHTVKRGLLEQRRCSVNIGSKYNHMFDEVKPSCPTKLFHPILIGFFSRVSASHPKSFHGIRKLKLCTNVLLIAVYHSIHHIKRQNSEKHNCLNRPVQKDIIRQPVIFVMNKV